MNERDFGIIVQIGDILVSEDVFTDYFSCDYENCKGICCIEGDAGAPLDESEPGEIERAYEAFSPLMNEDGRKAVDNMGFFELDRDGELVTPVVRDGAGVPEGTCAYAALEPDGACLCAIEKCALAGGCRFRKPVSCQLYPIRVTKLTGGGQALNVHHWDICRGAFEKGKREGIRVYQFLRDPIVRAYGEEFYEALEAAAAEVIDA